MGDDRPAVTAEVVEAQPEDKGPKHITRYEGGGIAIHTMADAMTWANAAIKSGFAPRGFNTAAQVIVAAQAGAELGLGPAASLRAMYVSPAGRPALYAESAHALVLRSGLLEDHRQEVSGEGDQLKATYHVKRKGMAWKSASFSVAEAKQAGLVKADSGWQKYPSRMVLARARAFALHDNFPDVLLGVAIEGDGVDEIPAEPQTPPAAPVTVPPPSSEPDALLEEA